MVKNTKKASSKTLKTRAKTTTKKTATTTRRAKPTGVRRLLSHLNKKAIGIVAVVVVLAAGYFGMRVLPVLAANSIVWSSGIPSVITVQDLGADNSSWRDPCQAKFNATKATTRVMSADPTLLSDCILGAHNGINVLTFNNQGNIAAQPVGDTVAYQTQMACSPGCVYLPNSDKLVKIESNNSLQTGRVVVYDNFTTRLHLIDSPDPSQRYFTVDTTAPTLISDYFGQPGYVGYTGFVQRSSDERYLVMDVAGAGLFRVDLNSSPLQLFKFSGLGLNYNNLPLPTAQFAISPDGQHVVLSGNRVDPVVIDITSNCGTLETTPSEGALQAPLTTECPVLNLVTPLGGLANNTWMPSMVYAYQPIFDSTGSDITFYGVSSDSSSNKLIVLRAANYNPTPSPTPTPTPSPTTTPHPLDKTQCLKNGWQNYGTLFKNQGDCVSYVESPAKK